MVLPVLGPAWLPVALVLYAAGASVAWHVLVRLLRPADARWVVAACLGASAAALLAPSPWIAGVLLGCAASLPVSLLTFRHRSTVLGHPLAGAAILTMCAVWVAALGLLTASLRATGTAGLLLAGLLGCAAYTTAIGAVQVARGLASTVWTDAGYGAVGAPVRVPTGFLHNTWKPAALNALLLPVALGLAWPLSWATPLLLLLAAGMVWQLWAAEGDACLLAAAAGLAGLLLAAGLVLPVLLAAPLGLIAYPGLRARLRANARWGAWRIACQRWRDSGYLGAGLGAWAGLGVQTPEEPGRRWHSAHNDWLETLVDCGPLPVLCALGYLGAAIVRASAGVRPLEAGLFGSLVALAVLSLGYMPWRTWPVNLFALGIVACWEALGR